MKERGMGSTTAFVLCLIAGFAGFLASIYDLYILLIDRLFYDNEPIPVFRPFTKTGGLLELDSTQSLISPLLGISLNIIIFSAAFYMRKSNPLTLKKAFIIALIASIINLNILGIIGSLFGLIKSLITKS